MAAVNTESRWGETVGEVGELSPPALLSMADSQHADVLDKQGEKPVTLWT